MVPPIVEFFAPILIGNDVSNIDELWRRMVHCGNFWCRVGLGASVLNGIEAALWDLKGKLLGLPVYELLGGRKHERLLAYATGGPAPVVLAAAVASAIIVFRHRSNVRRLWAGTERRIGARV